jgi:hypothetical protein
MDLSGANTNRLLLILGTPAFPLNHLDDEWPIMRDRMIEAIKLQPDSRLIDLIPSLEIVSEAQIFPLIWIPQGVEPLSVRSKNSILRQRIDTLGKLTNSTVSQISMWPNVGINSVTDMLRVLVEVAIRLDDFDLEKITDEVWPAFEMPPQLRAIRRFSELELVALESLVRWSSVFHRDVSFFDLNNFAESAPSDIQEAITVLQDMHLKDSDNETLPDLISDLLSNLDSRDVEIFIGRYLKKIPETLEHLGNQMGLTRERIRQRESRVKDEILTLLTSPKYDALRWSASEFANEIGSLVPLGHPEISSRVARITDLALDSTEFMFVCWAAGYSIDGDWLINNSRFGSLNKALSDIYENFLGSAENRTIQSLSQFDELLASMDIDSTFRGEIIEKSQYLAERLGHVANWPNNACDKALAILLICDEILSIEEILVGIDEDYSLRSLSNRLHEDSRFIRANRQGWALSTWNVEVYRNIVDSMKAEIIRNGGSALLNQVVTAVSENAGVAESSVRSYAEAPAFVQEGDRIRIRSADEPLIVEPDISGIQNVSMINSRLLRMEVRCDHETFRGSGRSLARGITATLGVQPGGMREFSHEFGTTRITWPMTGWQGGTLGSIRELLLESGVMLDQKVVLVFDLHQSTICVEESE